MLVDGLTFVLRLTIGTAGIEVEADRLMSLMVVERSKCHRHSLSVKFAARPDVAGTELDPSPASR